VKLEMWFLQIGTMKGQQEGECGSRRGLVSSGVPCRHSNAYCAWIWILCLASALYVLSNRPVQPQLPIYILVKLAPGETNHCFHDLVAVDSTYPSAH